MRTAIIFTIIALIIMQPSFAQSQHKASAAIPCFIEDLHGSVKLTLKGSSKPILLDEKRDRYRAITAGDVLVVAAGGYIKLQQYGVMKTIAGPMAPYTVPNVPQVLTAKIAALSNSTYIGGRARGGAIISPSALGATRASTCVIRWLPRAMQETARIDVSDTDGGSVWSAESIDYGAGKLESPKLQAALAAYRAAPRTKRLRLKLAPNSGAPIQEEFRILSSDEETRLDAELAEWNQEPGHLRVIGRAHTLARRGMFYDAAQEYEEAMAQAPQSRELIKETQDAEDLAGNYPRVRQLKVILETAP